MRKVFVKMDKLLKIYFGLEESVVVPQMIKEKKGKLILINTESFKRHTDCVSINKMDLKNIGFNDKEKLGIAIGKMIASDLVVSFEEVVIKRENSHAG